MRIIRKAIRICVFLSVFLLSLGLTRVSVHAAHSSDDAFAVLAGKTDYSGSPAHLGRSSAQADRVSAHLEQSALQHMLAAE